MYPLTSSTIAQMLLWTILVVFASRFTKIYTLIYKYFRMFYTFFFLFLKREISHEVREGDFSPLKHSPADIYYRVEVLS